MMPMLQLLFFTMPPPALLGGIGSSEILLIMVVMLLLFGPKQLPELAKTIGNALRGIRKATDEMKEEIGLDELVDHRSRRVKTYRPPSNVPPSLSGSSPNPSPTRRVSESSDDEDEGKSLSESAQQVEPTGPPDPYVELPDAPDSETETSDEDSKV